MDDLVKRDGFYYKKFTDVPFTGKVTGTQEGKLKYGGREGPWVQYFENGQLESKGTYKNHLMDGPWVGYHKNGQLEMKGDYKNGKREGPWVRYRSNILNDGQLDQEFSGTYKNGVKVD